MMLLLSGDVLLNRFEVGLVITIVGMIAFAKPLKTDSMTFKYWADEGKGINST